MKAHRALLAAAVLALAASPALAQNPPPESGRRMQGVLKGITLTGDQQAKIDSIRARSRAQVPAFTPGARPDSATREKMRELFRRQMEERGADPRSAEDLRPESGGDAGAAPRRTVTL